MLISEDGARFAFRKRELAVLTSMMADEGREGLAALWLHPGKAQAWATDGHRAVMVERDERPPKVAKDAKPVAVPAATVHHASKTARARAMVVIDISGEGVSIDVREATERGVEITGFATIDRRTESVHAVTCRRHQGGYGSIEGFFPMHHGRGKKGAIVPLNSALMAPVITLGKLAEPGGRVWINVGKISDPVTFVARSDERTVWRMLVMPLRAEAAEHPDHGRKSGETTRGREATRRRGSAGDGGAKPVEPSTVEPTRATTASKGRRRRSDVRAAS